MTAIENPVLTLIRLLKTYLSIVKDDGSLAKIHIGQEWLDREILKSFDGQITVGLERGEDEKLSFDGSLRRLSNFLRVNVWALDRSIREKMCSEISRIIHGKRNTPNNVNYNFCGIGAASNTHKAFQGVSASDLPPGDYGWNELADSEYQRIWYSDDNRFSKSALEDGKYALMLFRFKIDAEENLLKQLVLKFEGYGVAPSGNGTIIKVWNHMASAWENAVSGSSETDEVLTINLSSNLPNYVDADGYAYLLAKTAFPSNGATPAVLYCDYVEVDFAVNGIAYADITSFRDADEVRVKPFLWRTEFVVKSWFFENVTAIMEE
ncbi:MAG: hypothetical protein ACUVTB_01580 [Candidatus Bathycorpusculaceae bacterium]